MVGLHSCAQLQYRQLLFRIQQFCVQCIHFIFTTIVPSVYFIPSLASVTLFNCSVGRSDCSRCRTADPKYGCVWCGGASSSRCVYKDSCTDDIKQTCPAPVIHFVRYFYLLSNTLLTFIKKVGVKGKTKSLSSHMGLC